MKTQRRRRLFFISHIHVCLILLLYFNTAFAVTLPFSDNFKGNKVSPGADWTWIDRDGGPPPLLALPETSHQLVTNTLEINAYGNQMWGSTDAYACLYLDDVSGDFTAIVQVIFQEYTADAAKCGIMVRNDITRTTDVSGYTVFALTPSYGFRMQHDSDNNGYLDTGTTGGSGTPPDTWLKIQKTGTTFKGYYSSDGSNWTHHTTFTVGNAAVVQDVGLFVSSYAYFDRATVQFDNFSIVGSATTYTYYRDADGDTYGDPGNSTTIASATPPSGYVTDNTDCNDSSSISYPGATEICDGLDNDCDGSIDEGVGSNTYYLDTDGDGYGINSSTQQGCTLPAGYAANGGDCDDNDPDINPGKYDICGDGIDQDCSGADSVCSSGQVCLEIADIPLSTQIKAAPPLVMFLLDDSGSMSYDVLCPETGGKFYGGISVISRSNYWKSQYSEYNGIYYDPNRYYEPWELYSDADPNTPIIHNAGALPGAFGYSTRNLSSTFDTIDGLAIPYAHYYIKSASTSSLYLVIVDSTIKYHLVTEYGAGDQGKVTKINNTPDSSPPADIVRTEGYNAVRQNMANWYQYYRTRELVAKAALGKVIANVTNTRLGIHTLNRTVSIGVRDIKVPGAPVDYTNEMIKKLYQVEANGHTPLRQALEAVGQYYDATDTAEGLGPDPKNSSPDPDNFDTSYPNPYGLEDDGGGCQHAFTIVMTDGYYNGQTPSVGDADGDGNTAFDGYPFASKYTNTMGDVAMHFYERDLHTSLPNKVPTNSADSAEHQHMVTYTVSFGLTGTVPVVDTCPEDPSTCPTWPNPSNDAQKIDDLWHSAVNGRGLFYTASDTDELVKALTDLMTDIKDRARTGASVTMNTQKLESDTDLYQGYFDSADWSGDLKAYDVDPATGDVKQTESWAAKSMLDKLDWNSDRNILTFNGAKGIPFRYSDLTTTQKNQIDPAPATAQLMVNYLRGDHSEEQIKGGNFRDRTGKLGDIVSSSPTFHEGLVYVGANDGMLHAFNAVTGSEEFAFIPNRVIENLRNLTDPAYTHNYFVDGTVATATISGRSLLVGGLGKGGRGYYGMEITDGVNITESNIPMVWEYPTGIDNDMGFSYSEVSIVRSNYDNGSPVVIFGNGYDSPNGTAALYILLADGTLLRKINTYTGNNTTECNGLSTPLPIDTNFDGRVDYVFAGDLQGNMWKFDLTSADQNQWKISYSDGSTPKPIFQAKDKSGNPQAITGSPDVMAHCDQRLGGFMVVFGTGKYIGFGDIDDSQTQSIYGVWDWGPVWDRLGISSADKHLGSVNPPSGSPAVRTLTNIESSTFYPSGQRLNLLEQTQTALSNEWRETTNEPINWFNPVTYAEIISGGTTGTYSGGLHVGWFFDLPSPRERVITRTQIRDGKAIVVSIIPSTTPCSAGGSSVVHIMNACNGGELELPQFDTDYDDDIDSDDDSKTGKVFEDDIYYAPAILEDKMYFSKDEVQQTTSEIQGLHYWRLFQ